MTSARTGEIVYTLREPATVGVVDLRESIANGQRVAQHRLEASDGGAWREIARGTAIGYSRLARVEPTQVRQLRLSLEDWVEPPEPVTLRCFSGS